MCSVVGAVREGLHAVSSMSALGRFYGWSRARLAYRRRREVDHIHHRQCVRLYSVCSIQSKIVYARNGLVEYGQSVRADGQLLAPWRFLLFYCRYFGYHQSTTISIGGSLNNVLWCSLSFVSLCTILLL